jgi:hypothetical protein
MTQILQEAKTAYFAPCSSKEQMPTSACRARALSVIRSTRSTQVNFVYTVRGLPSSDRANPREGYPKAGRT